jgi:hypothetical protein
MNIFTYSTGRQTPYGKVSRVSPIFLLYSAHFSQHYEGFSK